MKNLRILPAIAALALAGSVRADVPPGEKSTLTIVEPLEVPGAVLAPGTYVVKLLDTQNSDNVVIFTSADEKKVYASAIATPHVAASDPRHSTFLFYAASDGSNKALRTWYASNDRYGQDFVYPPARAAALRSATNTEVPALTAEQSRALASRGAPASPAPQVQVPVTDAPAVAQAAPVASASAADSDAGPASMTADASSTLPRTASTTPLLLAAGAFALSLAYGLRLARRS